MVSNALVVVTRFVNADYGNGFAFAPGDMADLPVDGVHEAMSRISPDTGPMEVCIPFGKKALIGFAGYLGDMADDGTEGYTDIGSRPNLCFVGAFAGPGEDGTFRMPDIKELAARYVQAVAPYWDLPAEETPAETVMTEYVESDWEPVAEGSVSAAALKKDTPGKVSFLHRLLDRLSGKGDSE